jgi:hypothetical protein
MPTANPEYRPDWEQYHDSNDAERKKLHVEIAKRVGQPLNNDEKEELTTMQNSWDIHHQACCSALSNYQHETIQDAARWHFKNHFSPDQIEGMDFERLKTMKDVYKAFSEAVDAASNMEKETRIMKTGKPDGKDIFSDRSNLMISAETFQIRGQDCHVVTTIEQKDGVCHICFYDDSPRQGGMSVMNGIEDLASIFYERAILSWRENKDQKNNLGSLGRVFSGALTAIGLDDKPRPEQFDFYIHSPPQTYGGEGFVRADMTFRNELYDVPRWKRFDVIPESLQQIGQQVRMRTLPETEFTQIAHQL